MLLKLHEKYSQVLDDDERADVDDWFDYLDNEVYTFMRNIHSWLKNAETERKHQKNPLKAFNQGKASHGKAQKSLSFPMQGN